MHRPRRLPCATARWLGRQKRRGLVKGDKARLLRQLSQVRPMCLGPALPTWLERVAVIPWMECTVAGAGGLA